MKRYSTHDSLSLLMMLSILLVLISPSVYAKYEVGFFDITDATYGATPDDATDDTSAIQDCIDACLAAGGGTVWMPPGTYIVESLDITDNGPGITIQGGGVNATKIHPKSNNVHMFDLTGAHFVTLDNFQIGYYNQTEVPYTAIFVAQTSAYQCNALHFENLYVSGSYQYAALYVYGGQSSDIYDCDFYNYYDDNSNNPAVVSFTASNQRGASSSYSTVSTGTVVTSDWTLTACEIHDMSDQYGSSADALKIDGAQDIRYFGGNISGNGPQLVHFYNTSKNIKFPGTTFYSDYSGTRPTYIFYSSGTIYGLEATDVYSQCTTAVFSGVSGSYWSSVMYRGTPSQSASTASYLFYFSSANNGAHLRESILQCDGLPSVFNTITTTLMINTGAVTANTDSATKI